MKYLLVFFVLAVVAAPAFADDHECAACGEPIEGAYFETGGSYYHPDHFRCEHCGRKIGRSYTEYKGKNYHNDCFRDHVALRCDLCGGVVSGEYIIDYWGNAYHLRHQGEAPCCDSCSRFISPELTGGGVRYDDGRYICNICRPTSVKSIDEILALIDEVAEHLERLGMKVDYRGLQVHLVGRSQMQDISGRNHSGLRGFTDYSEDWRFLGRAKNRRINMYLLYAMPRMELISTIAHELTHVYLFNHGHFDSDPVFIEGSCNYAAFLVLGRYPGRESAFFRANMASDPDPVYGAGFNRVREYAEADGTGDWLKRVRRSPGFPEGY